MEKHFPVEVKKTEVKLRISGDENELERVSVSLLPQKSETSTDMSPVEPVNIDLDPAAQAPKKETIPDFTPIEQDVMRYIEKTWNVPVENIDVEIYKQTGTSFIEHRVYLT